MSFPYLQQYMSLSNGIQTRQAGGAAGVGGWVELGRTTLGSPGDSIALTSIPDKRYYMVLTSIDTSGNAGEEFRFNSDSGSNYSERTSNGGGADGTEVSQSQAPFGVASFITLPRIGVSYISNFATKEKLLMSNAMQSGTAGASNAPNRKEFAGKWVNTSDPIDKIDVINRQAGDFATGSELVVLGWDAADTHTTNFWEELASINASGSSTNLSSGTISAKKYLWVQCYLKNTTSHASNMTFNNDTTTYSIRNSDDGGTDATSVSQSNIELFGAITTPIFVNMFILNISANEKLVISHTVNQNTAGAGTAPGRRELVGKYDNTAAQITEIDLDSTSGNWDSSSIIKVWGSD